MPLPTQQQVSAAGRHVLTFSMGVVTAMAALHVISSGDAATISQAISGISSGLAAIATAAAPLIAIVSGWYAAYTASHKAQVASVKAAVNSGAITGVSISGTPR